MNTPIVLHVSTASSWRGGEQQLAYLVSELKELNVSQFILCVSGSAMEAFSNKTKISHFSIKKRSSFDVLFARRLAVICKEERINIIHVHDSHSHTFSILAM